MGTYCSKGAEGESMSELETEVTGTEETENETENGTETEAGSETGTGTGSESGSGTGSETTGSTSIINQAVEAVMNLIDGLGLFASITRGALGTGDDICCEIGPTSPETVWMDKNQYIPLDLTINGKHENLQTLSDAMNTIHESLTMLMQYPSGSKWQITDIATMTEPQTIGRENDNRWMMASALLVRIATYTPEGE